MVPGKIEELNIMAMLTFELVLTKLHCWVLLVDCRSVLSSLSIYIYSSYNLVYDYSDLCPDIECWSALWDMEHWCWWSCCASWVEWRITRPYLADLVLSGMFNTTCLCQWIIVKKEAKLAFLHARLAWKVNRWIWTPLKAQPQLNGCKGRW